MTLAKFHEIDAAMYAARKPGCNPAAAARKPRPGAYAFLGSGNLLPFYQGVVQGLQDRRVLTPEVMLGAKFSGFSGGSLTVVLTGERKSFPPFFFVSLRWARDAREKERERGRERARERETERARERETRKKGSIRLRTQTSPERQHLASPTLLSPQ